MSDEQDELNPWAAEFADGYYSVKQAMNEKHARERHNETCVSRNTHIVSLRKVT